MNSIYGNSRNMSKIPYPGLRGLRGALALLGLQVGLARALVAARYLSTGKSWAPPLNLYEPDSE
jgi:hypothetical protein